MGDGGALGFQSDYMEERLDQMKTITNIPEQQRIPAESHRKPFVSRLKKYTYVLPSGRVMKVVVDSDSELLASATPA